MRTLALTLVLISLSGAVQAQSICSRLSVNNTDEANELEATLTILGFPPLRTDTPSTAGCDVYISHPGSGDNSSTAPLSWVQAGATYIQISDHGADHIDNAWASVSAGASITITVNDPAHPIAAGLPLSWTSRGFWAYGYATSDFIGYSDELTDPDIADADGHARSLTVRSAGSGTLIYIGWNVYGSVAASEDVQLLSNAICLSAGGTCDFDGDGFSNSIDCNDGNNQVYPGAPEICDGLDNDCDGNLGPAEIDGDGDGFVGCLDDCNDSNPQIYPGAPEFCDGLLTDCDNGSLPPDEVDGDADGVRICDGDCNDANPNVHPNRAEDCGNFVDDNCNGQVDEDIDGDWDGVGACSDCNDNDGNSYPGATELCDGQDNDCNGQLPADEQDADGDGVMSCDGDCEDNDSQVYPGAPEICDDKDNDCNANTDHQDETIDFDEDGFSPCFDCDDENSRVYPGADEDACEDYDQDCDGEEPDPEDCDESDPPPGSTGPGGCDCPASGPGRPGPGPGVGAFIGVLFAPLLRRRRS